MIKRYLSRLIQRRIQCNPSWKNVHSILPTALTLAAFIANAEAGAAPQSIENEIQQAVVLDPVSLLEDRSGETTISGTPQLITGPGGNKAVLFNGVDDAIILNANPLHGLTRFTLEIIFRPDAGGTEEQRFLHIGEVKTDRMLLELRLTDDNQWCLDSFLRSGKAYLVLLDRNQLHPLGEWVHVALVVDEGHVKNFVNGELELEGELEFSPINSGRTSIGVRLNQVDWFKGAIQTIRITPGILNVESFLSMGELE